MGVKIYNEGRVVGYSAYELYVKHSLSEDPNTPPAKSVGEGQRESQLVL